MTQIRKTYKEINPDLLYHEIRDFAQRRGATPDVSKLETYSLPSDSSSFISRATLTFKMPDKQGTLQEAIRAHIVGSATTETKVLIDVDESLFPAPKLASLQGDLDFIFGSYEVKPRP